ncbi:gfo/Idh/MocA family oxidoreductase [Paludibacter sp. 221]|uniref:Gfo/Idh/MocA family protein n=1 Tax=Paludibacter sp. 221 TaxID=2302939 RepID=UPI0013D68889|nr:Gfo/Idh/MocA family oxidoreductase [Paludibacter sp. 221]NDV46423.1 gfo/Idh/MocA family oxidoreductase [Paludibacter sp. 221]
MKTIHWGIIGCGDVCEKKSGPAFYKIEHSRLEAVMRRDGEKAADFSRRHHVPKFYTNAEDLINDDSINAIYVATPPALHKEYTIQALNAGKPVYVEKPMAMNYAECMEMVQAAENNNQKLFVAYYRRALPYFLKVKELLDSQAVGRIQNVEVKFYRAPSEGDLQRKENWRVQKSQAGGGYFYDMAPHTLDILDFLLGEIAEARGFTGNIAGLYDVEDTVSAVFRFKSGVLGTGQWSFVSSQMQTEDSVKIIGTEGSILFNTFSFESIALTTAKGKLLFDTPQPEHIQQPLIQTIVDELRGVGECPSTGISGARTSKVIDQIFS